MPINIQHSLVINNLIVTTLIRRWIHHIRIRMHYYYLHRFTAVGIHGQFWFRVLRRQAQSSIVLCFAWNECIWCGTIDNTHKNYKYHHHHPPLKSDAYTWYIYIYTPEQRTKRNHKRVYHHIRLEHHHCTYNNLALNTNSIRIQICVIW